MFEYAEKVDHIVLCDPIDTDNFYPFSVMHPVWEMRVGCLRIFEKIQNYFPEATFELLGEELKTESFIRRIDMNYGDSIENVLYWNANILPSKELINEMLSKAAELPDSNEIFYEHNGEVFAEYIRDLEKVEDEEYENEEELLEKADNIIEIEMLSKLDFLHDAIFFNSKEIKKDIALIAENFNKIKESDYFGISIVNEEKVYIADGVTIQPGVVLDASEGPIILDENVKVMPNAVIIGPCYIGKNSTVKIAAKIYEDCSFGEYCKIGGEIENTIFQGYSNKQHDGFLGHSFISEWVNFGADTNNSDLKNTYGNIKLRLENREIETDRMFLGLLCGDHSKSAINTSFTTGTICGVCANLVHSDYLPNFISSFSWTGRKGAPVYKANKAIEIAKIVMARRGRELNEAEEKLLRREYDRINNADWIE